MVGCWWNWWGLHWHGERGDGGLLEWPLPHVTTVSAFTPWRGTRRVSSRVAAGGIVTSTCPWQQGRLVLGLTP